MINISKIDIRENALRNRGQILDILLKDNTKSTKNTIRNIIWATDSYIDRCKDYSPKKPIRRDQITGVNGKLIQPRAAKSKEEQRYRTKDRAEVFTPLKVVREMNMAIDWASKNFPTGKDNWVDYISEKRLEITCGEAPFIAGRYNPTADTGVIIRPYNRVGFLDRKLQEVNKFVGSKKDWLFYAEVALKSCYGYEWQGDNLLIARENVLQTMDDFYKDFCSNKLKLKSKRGLSDDQLEYFAEIISWNIWQMDGLKYVTPMSCRHENRITPGENTLFGITDDVVEKNECEGCKFNRPTKHNGRYSKIMDWESGKRLRFIDLPGN